MLRRQPRSTRSDTLFPDTTLFRSRDLLKGLGAIDRLPGKAAELYAWLVDNPQVEGESDGKFAARKLDAIKAILEVRADGIGPAVAEALGAFFPEPHNRAKIGRATWRERGCQYVEIGGGAGALKKKKY